MAKRFTTLFRTGGPKARVNYYPDTKSMYIHLSERISAETEEVREGVTLDFDSDGNLIGIGIDDTSSLPGFNPNLELDATEVRV